MLAVLIALPFVVAALAGLYVLYAVVLKPAKCSFRPAHDGSSALHSKVVICVGDSLTQATVSGDWLEILRSRFPELSFLNAGVNGDCAYNARAIRECQPAAVVVLIGTNDAKAEVNGSWGKHSRLYNGLPQEPSYDFFRSSLGSALEILLGPDPSQRPCLAVLTLPMLGESPEHIGNREVVPRYNQALQDLAAAAGKAGGDLEEMVSTQSSPEPPPVDEFMGLMWQGAALHYLLGWSWDSVGRRQGQRVMSDALHLILGLLRV
ncbi:unnamed protein product [Symbiodinium sp. CCMP2592]|nr:unnamed protein product [Symbiodinium sp. CCMP2592]